MAAIAKNKSDAFSQKIKPLMQKVKRLCDQNKISYYALFLLDKDEIGVNASRLCGHDDELNPKKLADLAQKFEEIEGRK